MPFAARSLLKDQECPLHLDEPQILNTYVCMGDCESELHVALCFSRKVCLGEPIIVKTGEAKASVETKMLRHGVTDFTQGQMMAL
ncbi:predicted protein [Plenodomus lingam JN3]|uniref:Predicted protein n=2 Tax=Leptosphaeria maculans TaxID=5022 RepID=E5A4G4_LEPMJ|nr:predicted protein [Plenodomus lingam JN3]CBX98509.1 predicted protein [Plenodomus lingam JN3]